MTILVACLALIIHWYISLFCQSFYLHRYAAHRMFALTSFWEKFFYILTWIAQGPSFLNPKGYALMHRDHHSFSDTQKDPHSPHHAKGLMPMMMETLKKYHQYMDAPNPLRDCPEMPALDRFARSKWNIIFWVAIYLGIHQLTGVPFWLSVILIPIHSLVGPIQGAIVNWCGHKYGYRNFNLPDKSKNTLPVDLFLGGELYQNNHHKKAKSLNFAEKWFEIDLTFQAMLILNNLGVIEVPKTDGVNKNAPELTSGAISVAKF